MRKEREGGRRESKKKRRKGERERVERSS